MQYLRRISLVFIVLYLLFIAMNALEAFWHGLETVSPLKSWMNPFMRQERSVHFWLDMLDFILKILFLALLNYFVRKNKLGKGYHFLIVLLAFLPLVYSVLSFVIWRKLNRSVFMSSGRRFTWSELKIVCLWVLVILQTIIPTVYFVLVNYSDSPEFISRLIHIKRYEFFVHSLEAFVFSIIYLLYFVEFRKTIGEVKLADVRIGENQLLDA